MHEEKILQFKYTFQFNHSKTIEFNIALDARTLRYLPEKEIPGSDWARLDNEQCANCPLNKDEHPYCPIALNLADILETFADVYSYEKVNVTVANSARVYAAKTSIQQALGSMIGIIMVSSGCPIMSKLRPMVRFHLPFATVTETVYRAASTYLLGEYFKHRNNQPADWDLAGLMGIYRHVQKVNMGMARRFRSKCVLDANLNALIVLDVFAKELPFNIEEKLKALEHLFQ